MRVRIDPIHAIPRMAERGATRAEVEHTVRRGRRSPAKYGRTCFTHTFAYNRKWHGTAYTHKTILAYAVDQTGLDDEASSSSQEPEETWLVVTVVVKFFNRRAR